MYKIFCVIFLFIAVYFIYKGYKIKSRGSVNKQFYKNLFDEAPVAVITTDSDLKVKIFNKACEQIFVNQFCIKIRKSVFELMDFEKNLEFKNIINNILNSASDESVSTEVSFPVDGKIKFFIVHVRNISANLKVSFSGSGITLYFVDITERKRLEEKFNQSQKMEAVGKLAGGVAHDFNNLLTAITGYCDLLLARHLPSDQSFNDIMQIKQNSSRAANLVKQLLAFSRRQTLQPKILDVAEQLSEISILLNRLIGSKVKLNLVYENNFSGAIKVDQVQFEQVIINLAVNARDAMPDGGVLTIKSSTVHLENAVNSSVDTIPAGSYILIEISDTGQGIEISDIAKIFEPFFSTKGSGAGTGLGLSTVYGIMNQTGGFISVENKIGLGVNFQLYFPYYEFDFNSTQISDLDDNTPKTVTDLTGSGKILLIEDEDTVRLFMARALRDKGYVIIEASDAIQGMDIIQNNDNIALIISDVMMPLMEGTEFLQKIRQIGINTSVMFISGYAEEDFRDLIEKTDSVYFLQKPFGIQEFASKVKEILNL